MHTVAYYILPGWDSDYPDCIANNLQSRDFQQPSQLPSLERATKSGKDEAGWFNDFPETGTSPWRQTAVTDASLMLSCRPGSLENSDAALVRARDAPIARIAPRRAAARRRRRDR